MGIILASILTLFINKGEDLNNKYLACLLILYLTFMYAFVTSRLLTFEGLLTVYVWLNISFCFITLVLHAKTLANRLMTLSVVLPQLLYLFILNKPYLLSAYIPIWFYHNADTFFIYGVFMLVYDKCIDMTKLRCMVLKDKILNVCVIYCLIMF